MGAVGSIIGLALLWLVMGYLLPRGEDDSPPLPVRSIIVPLTSLLFGVLVMLVLCYKTFGLSLDMSLDEMHNAMANTVDYAAVLVINALIGGSVLLLIVELRWDALRVALTVVVALIFGYLMTAMFNWDSAERLTRGEFQVKILSDDEPVVNIGYGDEQTDAFNPLRAQFLGRLGVFRQEREYRFAANAGDTITALAYAEGDEATVDLQLTLRDPQGNLIAQSRNATPEQLEEFRRDLRSESDPVLHNITLPDEGIYTLYIRPEDPSRTRGEFTLELDSEAELPLDLVYGTETGAYFNDPNVDAPINEVSYSFVGKQGDTISVLSYAKRQNIDVDVKVKLRDEQGNELAANDDATEAQVEDYRDLKSTSDAIIENYELPADGFYTVYTTPEELAFSTQFDEMTDATIKAYDAFLLGPLSRLNRWIIWMRDALTLIMLGLAIAIVFRAEQFSLGAEGQLYFGALVSGVVTLSFGDAPRALLVPIALLSAATAGFLWGLLPGALKAYLGANELVSTLMLNTIATRFYEMVLTWQLQPEDAGYTASEWIPESGLLTPIVDLKGDTVTIAVFLLIGMVIFTWLLIQRTPIGYEIRMIGSNIKFADYGGVNTKRTIMLVMAISGAVAGLAGAHLAMGIHRKLILNISIGLGFEGIVVALLARNNPLVIPFTGLLYSYLRTGARFMESDANVSSEVVRVIQAVIILLITAEALVTFFRRRRVRRRGTLDLDGQGMSEGELFAGSDPAEENSHV